MVGIIGNNGTEANKENDWSEVGKGCGTMARVDKDRRPMANNDDTWAVKKARQPQQKRGHGQG